MKHRVSIKCYTGGLDNSSVRDMVENIANERVSKLVHPYGIPRVDIPYGRRTIITYPYGIMSTDLSPLGGLITHLAQVISCRWFTNSSVWYNFHIISYGRIIKSLKWYAVANNTLSKQDRKRRNAPNMLVRSLRGQCMPTSIIPQGAANGWLKKTPNARRFRLHQYLQYKLPSGFKSTCFLYILVVSLKWYFGH